jgi:hypothetical protein
MSNSKSSTPAWIWIITTVAVVTIVSGMFSINSGVSKVGAWLLMLAYAYISIKTECFTKA